MGRDDKDRRAVAPRRILMGLPLSMSMDLENWDSKRTIWALELDPSFQLPFLLLHISMTSVVDLEGTEFIFKHNLVWLHYFIETTLELNSKNSKNLIIGIKYCMLNQLKNMKYILSFYFHIHLQKSIISKNLLLFFS